VDWLIKEITDPKPAEKKPSIEDVQKTYGDDLLKLKGVVGHGIGMKGKEKALKVFVKDDAAKKHLEKLLRDTIEGYPVVIEVTGVIKPL